jgi:hypothetical protein
VVQEFETEWDGHQHPPQHSAAHFTLAMPVTSNDPWCLGFLAGCRCHHGGCVVSSCKEPNCQRHRPLPAHRMDGWIAAASQSAAVRGLILVIDTPAGPADWIGQVSKSHLSRASPLLVWPVVVGPKPRDSRSVNAILG